MLSTSVNYWGVALAALAATLLGMIWYSPRLFGKEWMRLVGLSNKDLEKIKKKGMIKTYLTSILSQLVMFWVLAVLLATYPATYFSGIAFAIFVWLGFVATSNAHPFLWEGRPAKLYVLTTAYSLIALIIGALLLVALT